MKKRSRRFIVATRKLWQLVMYGEYEMSLKIPSVRIRRIQPDDVKRMVFIFSKDEDGNDVVHSVVGYRFVSEKGEVVDDARRFAKDLDHDVLRSVVLQMRKKEVVDMLLKSEGFE